ncbi:hypothetical protein BH23PAT1_BH23PAT1_2080 [soil metagenome]
METEEGQPPYNNEHAEESRVAGKAASESFLSSWRRFTGLDPAEAQNFGQDDNNEAASTPKGRWTRMRGKWRKFYRNLGERQEENPVMPQSFQPEATSADKPETAYAYTAIPETPPEVAPPLYVPPAASAPSRSAEIQGYQQRPIETRSSTEASRGAPGNNTEAKPREPEVPQEPEELFQKIKEATEQNERRERLHEEYKETEHERHNEIKDEPGIADRNKAFSGAASVGSIMAQKQAETPVLSGVQPSAPPASTSINTTLSDSTSPPARTPSIYKQAIVQGFWGGVIVLMFFLVVALLY